MKGKPPPDDDPLWQAVTRTVRPLPGRVPAPLPPRRRAMLIRQEERAALPPARPDDHRSPVAASLDGGWDKRIRRGTLEPDSVVDLHGHSLIHAHSALVRAVRRAFSQHQRVILVITGKGAGDGTSGRGAIRAALPLWLESPDLRSYVAALRAAHPRHGGAGAWYLVLRRAKQPAQSV